MSQGPLTEDDQTTRAKRIARLIAEELRAHPEHWRRLPGAESAAVDANGNEVDPRSDSAVCWCIQGLIEKHPGHGSISSYGRLAGVHILYEWNDEPGRTVEDVIQLCERIANG